MSKTAKKLCIVGTGFSGTAAFTILCLTEGASLNDAIEIITVEVRSENGPGFPYAPEELLPDHLCNNQAKVMSLHGNDFVDWMVENRVRLASYYPKLISETHPNIPVSDWIPDPDAFYPRALFGIYLQERFKSALKKAQSYGITVQTLNGYSVVDVRRKSEILNIRIRNNNNDSETEITGIDKLLLSIGQWVPKESALFQQTSMYLNNPYPFSRLEAHVSQWLKSERASCALRVYVKGMGPSGIDDVLSLAKPWHFIYSEQGEVVRYQKPDQSERTHIIVGSRCGFFPAVRGKVIEHKFKFLIEDTFNELERALDKKLKLDDIIELIDCELREATNFRLCWSDVVTPNFESAYHKLKHDIQCPEDNDLMHTILLKARRMKFYRFLNDTEKERYDRELDTILFARSPYTETNNKRLLYLRAMF